MVHPRKLERNAIVLEAITLLQEGGLAALTLRKLAERLGVSAPSLARHVGDKGSLTSLMAEAIFMQALDSIPAGLAGHSWLRAFGMALRDKQRSTRDITALVASNPPNPETSGRTMQRVLETMADAGLEGDRAVIAQFAIQSYVTGWMVFETSPRREMFARHLPHGQCFEEGLDALIAGFGNTGS